MSNMLSQDEINALLSGINNDEDDDSSNDSNDILNTEDYLSSIEQDALGEVGNISFGSAATALSTLLNQKVDITTPKVSIIHKQSLEQEFPKPHIAVHVNYTEGFEGMNLLVIKTRDAAVIANLMLGGDGTEVNEEELGEMEISAVQEAMNQMMGSASTSMSTIFNKKIDISPPGVDLMDIKGGHGTRYIPEEDIFVKIAFNIKVGTLIDSELMQLVTVSFAKELVDELMNPPGDEEALVDPEPIQPENASTNFQYEQGGSNQSPHVPQDNQHLVPPDQQYGGGQHQNYQQSQGYREPQSFGGPGHGQLDARSTNVQAAAFSNFDRPSLNESESKNLNMLLDIQLQVTVELGRTKRSIKEILEFSQGSIIELDKLAGEPVDILVNNKLVASGEVVVIDESFGVRVTDIISQTERLKNLQ